MVLQSLISQVARKEAVDETVATTTEETGMFEEQNVEKSTLHDSVTQDEQTIRVSLIARGRGSFQLFSMEREVFLLLYFQY